VTIDSVTSLSPYVLTAHHNIAPAANILCADEETTYHGVRGSASPVLTATGFVNWRWQYSTPHRINTLWLITKKFGTGDYVGGPYGCAKFGANPSMGGFWANRWNITKFFLFISFFHELTYMSDATTDFHAWWPKRRGLAQGCAFRGFRWHCSPFWGWNPPKPPVFGGVNRRF